MVLALSCGAPERDRPLEDRDAALDRVHAFEDARRATTDFRSLEASDTRLGPDPAAIVAVPGYRLWVGLLRGRSAIVLLDDQLNERQRLAAPASPSGLALGRSDQILVSSEDEPVIARYRLHDGRLERDATIALSGVRAVRAVAYGVEGVVYAVEDYEHRLLTLLPGGAVVATDVGLGPRSVLRTPGYVVVVCVLAHSVVVLPVDGRGVPRGGEAVRITHDGPLWAVDAREDAAGLVLAMGGVEDHPLDRRQGSFGYIDSFVYLYRLSPAARAAQRLVALNVSALGVVTPKVVRLSVDGPTVRVRVTGYGDATLAELAWTAPRPNRRGLWPHPEVTTRPFVPGTIMEAPLGDRVALANPLLDAWVLDDGVRPRVVPVPDVGHPRTVDSRVGEALVFTTLVAPWNRTKGSVSRFTCETCHVEGYGDGRIHDTGRGDVQVTTRPLLGLASVRPYFSRALDPDMTTMAHNEFRVAGMRSRHPPWFAIGAAAVPWLAHLGVDDEPLSPEALRRSLVAFLMDFTHRPNPAVLGRRGWLDEERRGAEIFRDRCEQCHEARLVTDREKSRVPFAEWEQLTMTRGGPIVWARAGYEKTGVVPYPHPTGTRVPSLRRLYKKRPYFTNGSAKSLDDVLRRARLADGAFLHEGGDGTPVVPDEASRRALRAFLDLL